MSNATLRLFKALPVDRSDAYPLRATKTFERTIPKGFVFAPAVLAHYQDVDSLINDVDGVFGVDPEALNRSFHKSFAKVRDASSRQLLVEQILHYITTYGADFYGTFDSDRVCIPSERLDVPGIDAEKFSLVVIRGMTSDELKAALLDLLSSGVALSEQSVKDALEVASLVHLSDVEISQVKNREVLVGLYELYGKVPANPVEFLRYVVYRTTGETLLINNRQAVEALKAGVTTHNMVPLFNLYINEHGIDRLGEIFLRFKPLFLALRSDKALRPVVNKIRRSAERNHKPMPVDYLNNVTALITADDGVEFSRLREELADPKINIFRKIRLAQALRVRTTPGLDSIVYKVRNGKSFATDFKALPSHRVSDMFSAYNVVLMEIAKTLAPVVQGKNIYIPDGVIYGLPSTEKQFVGNFPAGSYAHVRPGEALVAGVYWENQDGRRVDLDLSMANAGGKFGWDGSYRNSGRDLLFSGDVTDAPNGASEVYWIGPTLEGSWLMSVNDYTREYNVQSAVPYKIVIGTADAKDINRDFVFDSNRLVASAPAVIDEFQQNLGLIVADPSGGHRFYLGQTNTGGGISARYGVNADRVRKFMAASLQSAPSLNEVLLYAGANLVNSEDRADEGFDLSPAAIDKTTILSLLAGKVRV